MYIKAKMENEKIEPYATMGHKVPVVTKSDHPRFTEGTRLDWGFVETAIEEGYLLIIVP